MEWVAAASPWFALLLVPCLCTLHESVLGRLRAEAHPTAELAARRLLSLAGRQYTAVHLLTPAAGGAAAAAFRGALLRRLFSYHGVSAAGPAAQVLVMPLTTSHGAPDLPLAPIWAQWKLLLIVHIGGEDDFTPDTAKSVLREALNNKYNRARVVVPVAEKLRLLALNPYWDTDSSGSVVEITGREAEEYDPARDMNGHLMSTSLIQFPPRAVNDGTGVWGADIRMYETLTRNLNASQKVYWRAILVREGDTPGTISDAEEGIVDMVSNSQFYKLGEYPADFLYPHGWCCYCLFVPKAQMLPRYLSLFLPFQRPTWLCLLASVVGASCLWGLVSEARKTFSGGLHSDFATKVFLTIRVVITGSSTDSVLRGWSDKFVLLSLAAFSLVMTSAFQSSLTSYFAVPKYQEDIHTLEQLDQTGMGIYVHPSMQSSIVPSGKEDVVNRLIPKMVPERALVELPRLVLAAGNMSGTLDEISARYQLWRPRHVRAGRPLLHVVEECLLPGLLTYGVRRGSPLRRALDAAVPRVLQAGLPARWEREAHHHLVLRRRLVPRGEPTHQPVLRIAHLAAAFAALAAGLLLATAAFAAELLSDTSQLDRSIRRVRYMDHLSSTHARWTADLDMRSHKSQY